MTELAFHFNVARKTDYACRLLRKAVRSGSSVVVTAPPPDLAELDSALWTFSAVDFVPHEYPSGAAGPTTKAPVLLLDRVHGGLRHDVLLNLGADVSDGFERFTRVIEVVGLDDRARQEARARWKYYAERGYEIERFDLAGRGVD